MENKGFTLIELLIVVAIIGIIAAIAIPNLLRSRMSANEMSAMTSCKTVLTGQTDYNNNSNPHTYAANLQELSQPTHAGGVNFVDPNLARGMKQGYTFSMVVGNFVDQSYYAFSTCAWPVSYKSTGIRSFYIDESGVIRGSDIGGTCGGLDTPVMN